MNETLRKLEADEIMVHELYEDMGEEEKNAFTIGRISILKEFLAIIKADAFMGLSDEEWGGVKKFFEMNEAIRKNNNN